MNTLSDMDFEPVTAAVAPAPAPAAELLEAEPSPAGEEQRLATAAERMVARAQAFEITDAASYEQAGAMIDQLKTQIRQVEGFFAPMADAAHKAWKAITGKRASVTDPLIAAERTLSSRYSAFRRAEEERAAAERRAKEKAAQEQERQRLQAEADAIALEAQAAKDAAAQAASADEAQALTVQAAQLQQEAAAVRVEAQTVEAPVLPVRSTVAHVKGPAVRANWQHEVDDVLALVKAVAAGQAPLECVIPNETYLRARAKADKGTCRIAGVRFYDAGTVVGSRSKR